MSEKLQDAVELLDELVSPAVSHGVNVSSWVVSPALVVYLAVCALVAGVLVALVVMALLEASQGKITQYS